MFKVEDSIEEKNLISEQMNNKSGYKKEKNRELKFKINRKNTQLMKLPTSSNSESTIEKKPKKVEEDFEYEYDKLCQLLESLDDKAEKNDLGYHSCDSETDGEVVPQRHPNRRLQTERVHQPDKGASQNQPLEHENKSRIPTKLLKVRKKRKGSVLSSNLKDEKPKDEKSSNKPVIKRHKLALPLLELEHKPETVRKECVSTVCEKDFTDKTNDVQQNPANIHVINTGNQWSECINNPKGCKIKTVYPEKIQSSKDEQLGSIHIDFSRQIEEYQSFLRKIKLQSKNFNGMRYQEKLKSSPGKNVSSSQFLTEFYIPPAKMEVLYQKLTDSLTDEECLRAVCDDRKWPQPEFKQVRHQGAGFVYSFRLKGVRFSSLKPASNHKLAKELAAHACLDWLGFKPRRSADEFSTYF